MPTFTESARQETVALGQPLKVEHDPSLTVSVASLSEDLKILHEEIAQLEDKLHPILVQTDGVEMKEGQIADLTTSPLRSQVEDHATATRNAIASLRSLRERIDF